MPHRTEKVVYCLRWTGDYCATEGILCDYAVQNGCEGYTCAKYEASLALHSLNSPKRLDECKAEQP